MKSPGQQVSNMLLEISGEITPESNRVSNLSQQYKQTVQDLNQEKFPIFIKEKWLESLRNADLTRQENISISITSANFTLQL